MKTEHLKTLFSKLDCISTITFTGGEPSLHPDIILETIEIAKKHSVDIGSFYIATNAKKISDEFLLALCKLYLYCSDNEISQVQWSNDLYHDEDNEHEKLKVFSFFSPRYSKEYPMKSDYLINEGNSELNGMGSRNIEPETFEIDENNIIEGNVYLNCNGNLIAGCDFSYESQNKRSNIICKVEDFSLKAFERFTNTF